MNEDKRSEQDAPYGWMAPGADAGKPSSVSSFFKTGYNNGGRQRKYRHPAGNFGGHPETGWPEIGGGLT